MSLLRHEQCPRCAESGRDTSKDNLARYSTGSAYCFSCGYVERATKYVPKKEKQTKQLPEDLTNLFHEDNLKWLRKYLSDAEIMEHFRYSPSLKRHVFTKGTFWEARSVNQQPKTLSSGPAPYLTLGEGKIITVVEDIISAIKVARVGKSLCLFGSYLSPEKMVKLVKDRPSHIYVWLDPDKITEAREFSRKLNTLAPIASSVFSELDPKEYSTEQIEEFLCLS